MVAPMQRYTGACSTSGVHGQLARETPEKPTTRFDPRVKCRGSASLLPLQSSTNRFGGYLEPGETPWSAARFRLADVKEFVDQHQIASADLQSSAQPHHS